MLDERLMMPEKLLPPYVSTTYRKQKMFFPPLIITIILLSLVTGFYFLLVALAVACFGFAIIRMKRYKLCPYCKLHVIERDKAQCFECWSD